MATRAILITERYNNLIVELKKNVDIEIFPDLASIDLSDLVTLITLTFFGIEEKKDFEDKIKDLIKCHKLQNKISDRNLHIVVNIIQDFVIWLRAL
jgi:predicted DNA-binding ArsR family transcriptional regulator